jgi:predicted nucleotidyltransferase
MNCGYITDKLHPVIERYKDHIIFAYLFGSAARNDLRPLSDIDIAVFLSEIDKESYYDLKFAIHADLCRALKRNDIDVVILNTTTNIMLLDEIIRYGIVLIDGDRNLREKFEHKILHQAIDFKGRRRTLVGV